MTNTSEQVDINDINATSFKFQNDAVDGSIDEVDNGNECSNDEWPNAPDLQLDCLLSASEDSSDDDSITSSVELVNQDFSAQETSEQQQQQPKAGPSGNSPNKSKRELIGPINYSANSIDDNEAIFVDLTHSDDESPASGTLSLNLSSGNSERNSMVKLTDHKSDVNSHHHHVNHHHHNHSHSRDNHAISSVSSSNSCSNQNRSSCMMQGVNPLNGNNVNPTTTQSTLNQFPNFNQIMQSEMRVPFQCNDFSSCRYHNNNNNNNGNTSMNNGNSELEVHMLNEPISLPTFPPANCILPNGNSNYQLPTPSGGQDGSSGGQCPHNFGYYHGITTSNSYIHLPSNQHFFAYNPPPPPPPPPAHVHPYPMHSNMHPNQHRLWVTQQRMQEIQRQRMYQHQRMRLNEMKQLF